MFRFQLLVFAAALGIAVPTALRAEIFESFTEPYRRIELAPAESGVVDEINVREGDEVSAGQIVAALDRDVLTISRDIAAAAVAGEGRRKAALAEVRLRAAKLAKIRELRAKGHASHEEVIRADAEHESALGQLGMVEEQHRLDLLELKKAEAMIERRLIRSPIAGIVTKLHREQGEFVTPIAPTVATVVEIHPLRAVFNLPNEAAAGLRTGQNVALNIGDSAEQFPGKIEFIAPIIDADSDTVRIKVLIENPHSRLIPGVRCSWQLGDSATGEPLAGN